MAKKDYDWESGAEIQDHTRKKHAVLGKYLRQYLLTRCQNPHQERFGLAIIDAFAGGGLYKDGSYGSPLIFVDVLTKTANEINTRRAASGMQAVNIDCLLILNDWGVPDGLLKKNIAPLLQAARLDAPNLRIKTVYYKNKFDDFYPQAKELLLKARFGSVIFNLDQCGYSLVPPNVVRDIMITFRAPEAFLTFAIESMLTYMSPDAEKSHVPLEPEVQSKIEALLRDGEHLLSKQEWLGEAEKILFSRLCSCAPYVGPFSINNSEGWRYWLMHFAKSHRARQVYNQILHEDESVQAHYGRAGLRMLSYDPQSEGQLYLFQEDSRAAAKEALINDIPSFVSEFGDAMRMHDFYAGVYNETPAHSDDIHDAIILNPDMEVISESGSKRQKGTTIRPTDTIKLKVQRSFFVAFPDMIK